MGGGGYYNPDYELFVEGGTSQAISEVLSCLWVRHGLPAEPSLELDHGGHLTATQVQGMLPGG